MRLMTRRGRCPRAVLTLASLVALVSVLAASAAAAPTRPDARGALACGTTITRDTVLRADITGCTGPALIIGADGITLDLGGHLLAGAITTTTRSSQCEEVEGGFDCFPCDGPGEPACGPPFATPGGFVSTDVIESTPVTAVASEGFDRVTVRNGRLRHFQHGVAFTAADGFRSSDLREAPSTISFSGIPLQCVVCASASTRGRVTRIDRGTEIPTGVHLEGTTDSTVEDTAIATTIGSDRNTLRRVDKVRLLSGSDRNLVEGSRWTGGGHSPLRVYESSGNVIRRNTLVAGFAMDFFQASDNLVEDNVITGGWGYQPSILLQQSSRNIVRRNRMARPDDNASGVLLCDGSDANLIEGNEVRGLMAGVLLAVDIDCTEDTAPLHDNIVRGNRITESRGDRSAPEASGDGITVGSLARGTVVRGNEVLRNEGNGITVAEPSTRLRDNLALLNGGFGIFAPGAVDLGGNRASGNRGTPQCVGVVCGPATN